MPDDFADFGFVTDDKALQAILAKKSTGTPLKSKAIAELWDDAAKSKAFFSARVTSADILEGLRSQINHVVSGQASTEEAVWWMKRFLESKGDSALRDMGFATVEEAKATNSLAELGSHRRLTLIVEQNVAMARSAREWQQMQEDADIVPFVQYHTREDGSVRNSHALLNKKVFRKDDPALKRIFPPQDFRCRCRLDELDEDDAAGLPIQHGLPDGWKPPESGYSFDPEAWAAQGQDARDKWGEDLVEPFKADSMAHGKGRIEALQNNRSVMADLAQNSTDPRQKAEAAQAVDSLDQRISQVQADMQAKASERLKFIEKMDEIKQNKEKNEVESKLQANRKKEGEDLAIATKEEIADAAKKAIESGSVTIPKNIAEIKGYLSKVAETVKANESEKTNIPVEGTVSLGELLPKHKEQLGIPQDKKAEVMLSNGTRKHGVVHWKENHKEVTIDQSMAVDLLTLTLWNNNAVVFTQRNNDKCSIYDKDSQSLCVIRKIGAIFALEMVSLWNTKGSHYIKMSDLTLEPRSEHLVSLWFNP